MKKTDLYAILGVRRHATQEEIRRAYQNLARKFHPDVADDKAKAEEAMAAINGAYEILGDAAKRKSYDERQSRALVDDLTATAERVVDEYLQQFQK